MAKWAQKTTLEKFHFLFNVAIHTTLFTAVISSIYEQNWTALFTVVLAIVLISITQFSEKKYKIDIPIAFEISITLIIYCSIFLGEFAKAYQRFWWWDSLLHIFSSITIGLMGFLILFVFYKTGKLKTNPAVIALFSFCFALAIGAIWEIIEFGMDYFFGLNMVRSRGFCTEIGVDSLLAVTDTIKDLVVDSVGALIASIIGYTYLKTGEVVIFDEVMREFQKTNKRLFK